MSEPRKAGNRATLGAGHASLRHSPALILVVDDDANIRESIGEILQEENFAVRLACDGHDALRQFLNGPPDLILLDINMPDISGWQAYQVMAELYPFVPVIVITARPGQAQRAAELGINVLLEKPLEIPVLLRTIRDVLAQPDSTRTAGTDHCWPTKDHSGTQG